MREGIEARLRFARASGIAAARRAAGHLRATGGRRDVREPIFVIGCPRSGTTLLFDLLRRHPDLASLGAEGHRFWDAHQHPARKGWGSDRSTPSSIARDEPAFVSAAIARVARGSRFVDKTPRNALRVPYLDALFPDARFVFLHRDGRATVASLIEGWTARRGISYRLPVRLELDRHRGRYWSYVLPPGWRGWIRTSVPAVAALQYRTSNEIALDDLAAIDRSRVTTVSFEALLDRPADTIGGVLARLELPSADEVLGPAAELDRHAVSSLSPPRPGKWRDRAALIEPVLPLIEPTMRRLATEVAAG